MTNINDPWRDDEVTRLLKDLPEVEPPSSLVQDVMSTVSSRAATRATHPPAISSKRGKTMAKKVLWIVAAAAAAALIVMRFAGYPPVEKGTEATIGAAQRYQAPQISTADVKTDDAQLQVFLQSDLFRQLAADKAAQQALKNKDFQRALSDASVRAALASSDVRRDIVAMVGIVAAQNGVNRDAVSVKTEALQAALEASPALRVALASPDVVAALAASNALGVALAKPDISMFLSQQATVNAIMIASGAAIDAAAGSAGAAAGGAAKDAAPGVAAH
jgi:hypothetical protein